MAWLDGCVRVTVSEAVRGLPVSPSAIAAFPIEIHVWSATVRVAGFVVAEPTEFVNTARYRLPESVDFPVPLKVVLVAPAMFVKAELPGAAICHCTVGAGIPDAAAVKV